MWIWSLLETWRHSLSVRWRSMEKVHQSYWFIISDNDNVFISSYIFVNKTQWGTGKCFNKCQCVGSNISKISLVIEFEVLCIYMYDCVCLGPCLKRSFVKMQFNSSNDLTDPSIGENVLKQVRERNTFNLYDYCEKHTYCILG